MAGPIVARVNGRGYTQEELDALSASEVERLLSDALAEQPAGGGPSLGARQKFEQDPTMGIEPGIGMIPRVLADPDARQIAKENFSFTRPVESLTPLVRPFLPAGGRPTVERGQEITGLLGGLGKLALGAADTGISALHGGRPISQNQVDFTKAMQGEAERFTDPEKFLAEPDLAAANAAALVPTGGSGVLGTVGRTLQMADPTIAIARGAGLAGKVAQSKVLPGFRKVSEVVQGFGSGKGTATAEAISEGAVRGESGAAFRRNPDPEALGQRVIDDFGQEVKRRGQALDDVVQGAEAIDVSDLKRELLGDLTQEGRGGLMNELGIKVSAAGDQTKGLRITDPNFKGTTRFDLRPGPGINSGDGPVIQELLQDLVEGPDQISVDRLNKIKQGMDAKTPPNPARAHIFEEIRGRIRAKLGEVEGFNAPSDAFKEIKDFERRQSKRLGVKQLVGEKADNLQIGDNVVSAFDESTKQLPQLKAVKELEEFVPNLRTDAASIRMSPVLPSGLAGKNAGLDAVRGIMAGSALAAGLSLPSMLAQVATIPIVIFTFSPNAASRSLAVFGKNQKLLNEMRQLTGNFLREAERRGVNVSRTTTIGEVLARMPDYSPPDFPGAAPGVFEDEGKTSFMGRLGSTLKEKALPSGTR